VEDEEIRAALRRGDVDGAFRRFARAHGRAAYGPCYRIVGTRASAEDVMQEALIAAFENRTKMMEVNSLRAWLITIAIRKAYDALRSARRSDRVRDAVSATDLDRDDRDVVDWLAASADQRALQDCLNRLEPDVHAAILLRYREERSWEEIAHLLGVPLDTIRMRVQRGGLKSLKLCLESKNVKP
jgi:RNA polymerase sigma-70 factor, ECF subfamily